MRILAALAIVLLALPAAAQHEASEPYQLRAAFGDVPTTSEPEPDGWNVVQSLRVEHAGGNDTQAALNVPAGHTVARRACDCPNFSSDVRGSEIAFTIPGHIAAGTYNVTLTTTGGSGEVLAVDVDPPAGVGGVVLHVYVPEGKELLAPVDPVQLLPCASGDCTIATFRSAVPWFTVQPEGAVAKAQRVPPEERNPWLFAGLGFIVGVFVWGFLVSRGVVQKRRRQEVQVAAHREAAAKESSQVLEARKRALMAALKEVEVARMQNEIDVATFETVKADLKRQTVTVLRAIEEAHAAEEKGGKGAAAS